MLMWALYLVAVLQQQSGGGQLINGVQVEGARRGVVWRFGNFLQTQYTKSDMKPDHDKKRPRLPLVLTSVSDGPITSGQCFKSGK